MKLMYIANVLVAGWIAILCLWKPDVASRSIFSGAYVSTDVVKLVGCLWLGIALLSACGIFYPAQFAAVFLLQLVYKGVWIFTVATPCLLQRKPFPSGMAVFFLVWMVVLPFLIPWKDLFQMKT